MWSCALLIHRLFSTNLPNVSRLFSLRGSWHRWLRSSYSWRVESLPVIRHYIRLAGLCSLDCIVSSDISPWLARIHIAHACTEALVLYHGLVPCRLPLDIPLSCKSRLLGHDENVLCGWECFYKIASMCPDVTGVVCCRHTSAVYPYPFKLCVYTPLPTFVQAFPPSSIHRSLPELLKCSLSNCFHLIMREWSIVFSQ